MQSQFPGSGTQEALLKSLVEVCKKINVFVTDAGAQMQPSVAGIDKWKKELGITMDTIWLHCNAHIEPALSTALTKVLVDLEEALG